jgi:hypothetical protein
MILMFTTMLMKPLTWRQRLRMYVNIKPLDLIATLTLLLEPEVQCRGIKGILF